MSPSGPHRSRRLALALTATLTLALGTAAASAGAASFVTAPGTPLPVGAQPYSVLTQDLNGDGRVDVGAIAGTASNLSVFLGSGTGSFAAASGSPFATGAGPSGVAVADFNGDGRADIAVSNYVAGSVTVLLGQPGGTWSAEAGGPGAPGAGAVAATDVNGDGRPDLLVTDFTSGGVWVLLRKAAGGFEAEGKAPTGDNPRAIAVADFNGDGRPDMAVTNFGSGSVSVLLRQPGAFAAEGAPIPVGSQPIGIDARDLDGDGRPDLAVTGSGSGNVSLLLRGPLGGFTGDPASPIAVGAGPTGVVAPDLNGDGRPDLAVTSNAAGTVNVLLRSGAGFAAAADTPIALPANPSGIAAGDVDGDGRPDLAVSSDQANVLNVLLNRIPTPASGPGPGSAPIGAGIVTGVSAGSLRVSGAGGKAGPRLTRQLNGVELGAALGSPPATSIVATKGTSAPATPDPGIQKRLESYEYGIPVTVIGNVGEIVGVAGAAAVFAKAGSGGQLTTVQLPPAFTKLYTGATTIRLPIDQKAAAVLGRSGIDEAALAITAQQIAINKATEASEEAKQQADEASDRKKKMLEELQKLLDILRHMNPSLISRQAVHQPSRKVLQRRAARLARQANALDHKIAVLLAPIFRAHPVRSPRVTLAVKPCPKKCYPRFGR